MTMLHLNEIVAIKMQDGLTKESDKIADIGRVLVDMGKSRTERIWLLSHEHVMPETEYGFFLAKRE